MNVCYEIDLMKSLTVKEEVKHQIYHDLIKERRRIFFKYICVVPSEYVFKAYMVSKSPDQPALFADHLQNCWN